MQIYGPYRLSANTGAQGPQRTQPQQAAEPSAPKRGGTPVDQLDLTSRSGGAGRIDSAAIAGGGEIRIDRVAEIRRQIADGSYETPEKLDAALDQLLDQIA